MKPNLEVDIAGIRMKNPVMPAAGTFGFGEEMAQFFDLSKLGAIVPKSITLEPRIGNPPPRIFETSCGMINTIGLENPGVEGFIRDKMSYLESLNIPIIVSIAGKTKGEYAELAKCLCNIKGVSGFEINVSCPNVEKGMAFGQDPAITRDVVSEVRRETALPLIVKLTPNVTDIKVIAQSAVKAGANALSLINTVKARAIIHSGPHAGKTIVGGLSGPCIKPIALQKVAEVVEANLGVPIIGIGGITDVEDVLDFLRVGATAVQIGTANFVNPKICEEIIDGIEGYLNKHEIRDINELIGSLRGGDQ